MFECQVVAREMVTAVKPIMDRTKDSEVRDQLKRASLSVLLNIAEANARRGKDRSNRFGIAEGSAREAEEAVWTAIGWGYVTQGEASQVLSLLDRVIAMLVRLRFPRKR
jgi:four helix bundle protein